MKGIALNHNRPDLECFGLRAGNGINARTGSCGFVVEPGKYEIPIGASFADIRGHAGVQATAGN